MMNLLNWFRSDRKTLEKDNAERQRLAREAAEAENQMLMIAKETKDTHEETLFGFEKLTKKINGENNGHESDSSASAVGG